MRIAFWLTTPRKFDPKKVDNTPFGGAEISAINLARKLSSLSNKVYVFGNVNKPYLNKLDDNGIFYFHYDYLKKFNNLDVLICVRADQNLLNPRRNYLLFGNNKPKKIILWTGDAYDQPNNQILHDKYCLKEIDLIVCKSNWQKKALLKYFPLLSFFSFKVKVQVMYNGVCAEYILPISSFYFLVKTPQFICASTIYRGLHRFLDIWPKIKEKIPDAILDLYCKTTLYIENNPRDKEWDWLYKELSELDGIVIKKPIPQKELLKILPSYYLMLYPNCGFNESSCGIVLESMACGVPVITSAIAGLSETVGFGGGICINLDPETTKYEDEFVNQVFRLYNNNDDYEWLSGEKRNIIENYSWQKVARRWNNLLIEIMGIEETERQNQESPELSLV